MIIFQAILRFVVNRVAGLLLFHARRKTASLNHEAGDDAVKDGVVIVSAFNIFDEVGNRQWRFFCIKFERDDAVIGNVEFNGGVCHDYLMMKAEEMVTAVLGTSLGKGPEAPVGMDFILSTTSMPAMTLPTTV